MERTVTRMQGSSTSIADIRTKDMEVSSPFLIYFFSGWEGGGEIKKTVVVEGEEKGKGEEVERGKGKDTHTHRHTDARTHART